MKSSILALPLAAIAIAAMSPQAATAQPTVESVQKQDEIPFEQFTLPNGLRVVVHEDHSVPKVAVAVWYHVGSMNEPDGKSGYAHLFEHLMFNGSENRDDEYFPPLQEIGASAVNGATSYDQTYYFEVVPTGGLERVLWLESDRMGNLLGAVTQAKLDEQRGVVQNEKRTYENRPYSSMAQLRNEALFPAGHPYNHSVIGSMEDLDAASLDDMHGWFKDYYGASNAVVSLAGDISVEDARRLVTKYFGAVPPGPAVSRLTQDLPLLDTTKAQVVEEAVPQTAISWAWPVPGQDSDVGPALRLASSLIGSGRLSRLNQALVVDRELATTVFANYESYQLAGVFEIGMRLKEGVDPAEAETVLREEIDHFLAEGPSEAEMERTKTGWYSNNVRARESLFVKAMTLAGGLVFDGDPASYLKDQAQIEATTATDVRDAAREWLNRPNYQLTVVPPPDRQAGADGADRTQLPPLQGYPELTLPAVREGKLSNGIKVLFAERPGTATVDMSMTFDAGSSADLGRKDGIEGFTNGLLNEGTQSLTGNELADREERLGARIYTTGGVDTTTAVASALVRNLPETIDLWADMIRHPAFREEDIARAKAQALSRLAQSENNPDGLASDAFGSVIYGEDHAYATRLGDRRAVIESYDRADLTAFYDAYLRPDNATIYAAGASGFDTVMAELEDAFGDWKAPQSPLGQKNVDELPAQDAPRVILVDKPGAIQSVLRVGRIMPSGLDPINFDLDIVNSVLGGGFTSRLNTNLREEKGWTYGAGSGISSAIGPQAFQISTSVQTDKTKDALVEIKKELDGITGERPASEAELELVRRGEVLTLSDRFETNSAMVGYLQYVDRFNHPVNWIETLPDRYASMTPGRITQVSSLLDPEAMTWVIVGDLSKIEDDVRRLGLGRVEVRAPDGKVVR
ncbi:M16 family metallopeptidase [Alteriqipengyuania lutimaris]|uniref:Insulinase family protein n=1 Tax=Alteriqipengyuania lutimaris TaxID=1538146 RepID=A0A395LK60_9SPHN|nr:pitrilysin family protein [Alteriqipengyuania lutimaris]MBB3033607.1 putative Zn-dependent peptidase [Alteriqipengyuania lutimaris]RDS77396.1 insulinase family protein [Alteriqipengyuania lutimaris]